MRGVFALLLVVAVMWPAGVSAQTARVLRVMPMGDSLTVGENRDVTPDRWVGYRLPLYQRLTAAGVRFDFVGSIQSGDARLPDRDLEARGGRTIQEIAVWAQERVRLAQPDVVLLLAGTNDAAQGLSDGAGARYRHLLQQIREGRPDAEVLAATVPPIGYGPWQSHVGPINEGIRWAVAQQRAAGQRVTLIETPGLALSSDSVHPSEIGYATLGETWAASVLRSQTVACSRPDRVAVQMERGGPGQMRVAVTSRSGSIERIAFGTPRGVRPIRDLTITGQTARFTLVRSGQGGVSLPFTVTDGCGSWPSFVGGGPGAF